MHQQVKKELKNQVVEKRAKELRDNQAKIDDENLTNIVSQLQSTEEFTKDLIKKENTRQSYKQDLQNLIKDNKHQKIQNSIGISREEITLNKQILASMLSQNGSPLKSNGVSPNKFEEILPVVSRK